MKKLKYIALGLLILPFFLYAILYKRDFDVATLKEKYTDTSSKWTRIDGMDVHYREEGNGMPILLIHGTGSCLQTWDLWTLGLKDTFKVIRLDIPGFGLTGPRPDNDYTIAMYSSFLDKFASTLQIDSFYLGGNSLGGEIAWYYATQYPKKVKKLVLVDPGGFHNPDKGFSLVFEIGMRYPKIANLISNLDSKMMVKNTLKECYYDDSKITDEDIQMYYDMSMREGNRKAFTARVSTIGNEKMPNVADIIAPTLLMWGDKDQLIDISVADSFATIPILNKIIYPNVGHMPHTEVAEQSLNDVRAFLLESNNIVK
jgi:pimeloyl-ACP methyl ester carboxylesterase